MKLSFPVVSILLASRASLSEALAVPSRSVFTRSRTALFSAGDKRSNLESLTVPVLKDQLRSLGLKVSGNKGELISRLSEAENRPLAAPTMSLSESLPPNAIYISA
eukprot:CAMPEP_0197552332 /NCGR_PEP_ID=MMETSP1320-20131121/5871_1 /TAXON_ID=91990 /ORGANISM="Bolidomonas sp., Strain RCC2347" /LENGTH=105 /DNA_ID=CAMNT_0043112911 /DNA_START=75 /DNA_END=388 /DNA_ORIENTATION=+